LTQDFFLRLLERDLISQARRDRGKFRSFLLTTFRNFLVNEWKKGQAMKRGGGQANFVSLDDDEKYSQAVEAADERTAQSHFERRWALAVLEQALARLRSEMGKSGKAQLFEALKDYVWGEHGWHVLRPNGG
jgi:RNA polymerase sigma-70 factor (ECF subfamily)